MLVLILACVLILISQYQLRKEIKKSVIFQDFFLVHSEPVNLHELPLYKINMFVKILNTEFFGGKPRLTFEVKDKRVQLLYRGEVFFKDPQIKPLIHTKYIIRNRLKQYGVK